MILGTGRRGWGGWADDETGSDGAALGFSIEGGGNGRWVALCGGRVGRGPGWEGLRAAVDVVAGPLVAEGVKGMDGGGGAWVPSHYGSVVYVGIEARIIHGACHCEALWGEGSLVLGFCYVF